jgi:hypothetical protein
MFDNAGEVDVNLSVFNQRYGHLLLLLQKISNQFLVFQAIWRADYSTLRGDALCSCCRAGPLEAAELMSLAERGGATGGARCPEHGGAANSAFDPEPKQPCGRAAHPEGKSDFEILLELVSFLFISSFYCTHFPCY